MSYDVVSSVEDLRLIDDCQLLHMSAALVEGFSWFLLHRDRDDLDDGKSCLSTWSGNGRWLIMTPSTVSIVTLVLGEPARATVLLAPRSEEFNSTKDVELAVLVNPEETGADLQELVNDLQELVEADPHTFELDDFLGSEELTPETEDEGTFKELTPETKPEDTDPPEAA